MALSLKCGQCGVLLRSMKEAQDHGEATGHSQFEESTEAILTLVCAECGKPCRSETEKDIHTKRTGHSQFVDKTHEAAKPIVRESFLFSKTPIFSLRIRALSCFCVSPVCV